MVDIDELRQQFLNLEFDSTQLRVSVDQCLAIAHASGERRAEFTDSGHPNFQAPLALLASLAGGRHLPIDFPSLGGIPMDGGKAVTSLAPVRPGSDLTGRTHLHDIYDKSGRSGRMIFIVSRMNLYDSSGSHLAISDSRMVVRERAP